MPSHADGLEFQDFLATFRGGKDVFETEHHDCPSFGRGDKVQSGFQNCNQRRFRAHQRPRDMKAVFRQEVVEIIARDAAL